jgi:nitrogenase molybdenum-iron protein alpha/beta subunit
MIETADPDPVIDEIARADERIVQACDKYLRRFDPPRVAVFSGLSAALFAAGTLAKYLDAEIVCIGSRTEAAADTRFTVTPAHGLSDVRGLIARSCPDLVVGSSFERSVKGDAAFVGITPPLRGRVRLSSRPLAGTEGTLAFVEDVLNACMDRRFPAT